MKKVLPIEKVAAEVCEALRAGGIQGILVGGAVVSIYSDNEYESFDLDFVVRGKDSALVRAMESIGFKKGKRRHFERPGTPLIVEFLSPPPGIGGTTITHFSERRTPNGRLTLYEPTHCVMDRLAHYYHWKDPQGLAQAVLVARRHRIRMREIEAWSRAEGMSDRFREFAGAVRVLRRRKG